jgi:hypothetical protein
MKLKHNKKRNTAFLFETLVRELTRAAIRKDVATKVAVTTILKEHFGSGTLLHKELDLYRSLCESTTLAESSAQRLLKEVKEEYKKLDKKSIFMEQGAVIKRMNRELSKEIFNTFVPNYKNLATVYQIFNGEMSPAKRVLLEDTVLGTITKKNQEGQEDFVAQIDNLVIKNFIKKFNQKYYGTLSESQGRLMQNYILSFTDNAAGLKAFLNEEIGRLREVLRVSLKTSEVKEDVDMVEKTNKVLEVLDGFKQNRLTRDSLSQILKIQNLAAELEA